MKTKIDFITDLLGNKKLHTSQKERLFSLVAEDLKGDKEEIKKIWEEIDKIKEIDNKNESIVQEKKQTSLVVNNDKNKRLLIHKPKDVANFMYLFNKRDGLKYLTHDYDEEGIFEIDTFLKNAKELFDLETKKLSIPKDLYSIVYQFAFSENPNWGNNIKEGFSSPKWIEWSKKNGLSPIRNKEFELVINKFRNLTRVESPNLKNTIDELINEIFKNSNFEINQNRLDKADFYTNTFTFRAAIKSIFEVIYKKRKSENENNKLTLEYKGVLVNNYYEVSLMISHFNSYPTKDFKQLLEEWRGDKGAIGDIKAKLFGYCDWSIETKLDEVCYRINLLKEDSSPDYEAIPTEPVNGTMHILKFYYKTSD